MFDSLPKIVRPEWWYMAFWSCVFLPLYGLVLYFAVKWAVIAALKEIGK